GAEVLDDDVGLLGEREEDLPPAGAAEVGGDRALVAPQRLPPQVYPVLGGAVVAGGVGPVGVLDLDDVGAHVTQVHRGHRAGEEGGGVDDAQAGEGPGRGVTGDGHRATSPSQAQRKPIVAERARPRPGRRYLREWSGAWTPPSTYQSEPAAREALPSWSLTNRARPEARLP